MTDFFARNPNDIVIKDLLLPEKTKKAELTKDHYFQLWLSAIGTGNEDMVIKWVSLAEQWYVGRLNADSKEAITRINKNITLLVSGYHRRGCSVLKLLYIASINQIIIEYSRMKPLIPDVLPLRSLPSDDKYWFNLTWIVEKEDSLRIKYHSTNLKLIEEGENSRYRPLQTLNQNQRKWSKYHIPKPTRFKRK